MNALDSQLTFAWQETAKRAGIPQAASQTILNDLCGRYSEPDRHYHNLRHIAQMLDIVSQFRSEARDYVALCLAVWFHDAVYDTRRRDNEEQSGLYADALLKRHVWTSLLMRVFQLIDATKTHQSQPGDTDTQLLLDADLAILGADPADYVHYAQAIRWEYARVPDEEYRAGRRRVLKGFLGRERIYQTAPLFQAWEVPARRNLQREIEHLAL